MQVAQRSVSAGASHTCAVLDDDSLKCWGDNERGQLGVGDQTDRFVPTGVDLDRSHSEKCLCGRQAHVCGA